MAQDRATSGDFGYDLVHDDVPRPRATAPTAPTPTGHTPGGQAPSGSNGRSDRREDLGYDEAHDF
ncbi:MAG: hypothetical protein QOJ68_2006 [Blastococcus sp.]|jgi:hypothetical protein|nr:hypothetical protein [Blastococcus sp.]